MVGGKPDAITVVVVDDKLALMCMTFTSIRHYALPLHPLE
jgi:hypothetical protein